MLILLGISSANVFKTAETSTSTHGSVLVQQSFPFSTSVTLSNL